MPEESSTAHQEIVRALMGIEPTDETYRQIGRFFHMFSQVEILLRLMLVKIIDARGDLFDEVTAAYDFNTLCNVVKAVSKKAMPAERAATISTIAQSAQKLNEDRVRIAHGTWVDSNMGMTARHVSRTNLEAKLYYQEAGDLMRLADRAATILGDANRAYAELNAT